MTASSEAVTQPVTGGDDVIQTRGLTAYFGATCAMRELTLSVPRGGEWPALVPDGTEIFET